MELTDRQRRLLWEMVTMVDPDTLNDNLERVGLPPVERGERELTELMQLLDPDDTMHDVWNALPH